MAHRTEQVMAAPRPYRGSRWSLVGALGILGCADGALIPSPTSSAPMAMTRAPGLPAGYDWSLDLGGRFNLTEQKVTVVSPEEAAITKEYFAACERDLGKFPVETLDCGDAQEMPVTSLANQGDTFPRITGEGALPASLDDVARCDRPSLIYRDVRNVGCSSGSRIKRVSNATSDWVYVCRKGHKLFNDEHLYSEIGLIGSNRSTGKTCFFAGRSAVTFTVAVTADPSKKSELLALAGKKMPVPASDAGVASWSVPTRPGCTSCHSQGAWLHFPFIEGTNSYAELSWGVDDLGDPKVQPVAVKRYIEADGKPVVPPQRPGALYQPMYPDTLPPLVGNDTYKWPQALRLKPDAEGAGMCTSCHQIGNQTYSQRYPRSVFYFNDALTIDRGTDGQRRANLYLANLTAGLRGSHNTRMLSAAWGDSTAAQVPGFPITNSSGVIRIIKDQDIHKDNTLIRAALDKIDKCGDSGACWGEHWTIKRVEADPLRYLQETCSYCHSGEAKSLSRLTTKAEFVNGGNAWSRMSNRERPHPPGGRLEESVLTIVGRYLNN
jgi:hypothetical protein